MRYYQYHIGDFNNATRYASRLERSIYRDLLDMYYEQESAIDGTDISKLQRRLNVRSTDEQQALDFVLTEYFENQDGFYFNDRCESEIKKYQDKLEGAIKAGKASAEARRKKAAKKQRKSPDTQGDQDNSTVVQRTFNDCSTNAQPTNNQEPLTKNQLITFDDFWNVYDKKIDVAKCKAKWSRLSDDEKNTIAKTINDYVSANANKKYRKNPLTYLNGQCWLDEIINTQDQSLPTQNSGVARPHENRSDSFDQNQAPKLTKEQQREADRQAMEAAGV